MYGFQVPERIEPGAESVRLAELEPHALRRAPELGVARAVRKQVENPLLLGAEIAAGAASELRQNVAMRRYAALDSAPPLTGDRSRRDVDGLIDDVEPQVVVNEAGVRIDLGVDAGPKAHRGLERRGTRKQGRVGLRDCGGSHRAATRAPASRTAKADPTRNIRHSLKAERRAWKSGRLSRIVSRRWHRVSDPVHGSSAATRNGLNIFPVFPGSAFLLGFCWLRSEKYSTS